MGEAFNRDGQLLGDVEGESFRDVLDKLQQRFSDAHEVRIRRLDEPDAPPKTEMPKYESHKVVWAMKIGAIERPPAITGDTLLVPGEGEEAPAVAVSPAYIAKHQPSVGGYYVRYKDGYESFSPAKAFEEGYTRIT